MSRYAETFERPSGPGHARPAAFQIAQNEQHLGNMKDKVFLITGCSSGIGIETARVAALTGAKVFLAVQSLERGQAACGVFLEPGRLELLQMDTSSLASVRTAVAEFLQKSPKLNVLICNAAIMANPTREESVDGFELQLETNYFGHFLLLWLLKHAMLEASAPEFNSRLINVSSSGHHAFEMQFEDLNLAGDGAYEALKAYGHSKLAQIYMSNQVEREFGARGLHSLSLMPGAIMTNLQLHMPEEMQESTRTDKDLANFMRNPEQGAATTIYAALSHEWEGKGGRYLEDCRVASEEPLVHSIKGVRPYAYDEAKEARLWKLTLEILGLSNE